MRAARQLATVAGALWRSCRLIGRYRHRDGTSERRKLDPLGLVLKGGNWYLVADCPAGIRPYRVGRLSGARVLDEEAVRPKRFDLAAYWARSLADYEASRPQVTVRVRVARRALPELERVLAPRDRTALRAAVTAANDGDWITLSVHFERAEHAHRDLLGLADQVEVLDPPELRNRIASSARSVAALY
jgi:predicted DNA-binding transcriptional regulator YafY